MKKFLVIALAVLMITALAVPAFAANDGYTVTLEKDYVDILTGKAFYLHQYNKTVSGYQRAKSSATCLTDGIFAYDALASGTTPRADYSGYWATNTTKANELIETPTYSFGGIQKKYLYGIEIADTTLAALGDNVTEFAIYTNRSSATVKLDDCLDGAFDILISTDKGVTYEIAWSSKASGSNKTTDKGGDWTEYTVKDGETVKYVYREIKGKLNKAYNGVTNVVYAVTIPRYAESTSATKANYAAASLSEIDVYSTPKKNDNPPTGDTSMIVAMILGGAVAVTSSVIVIRKRREDI